MKWWKRWIGRDILDIPDRDSNLNEARFALHTAEEQIKDTHAKYTEIKDVAASLREERERNRFSEKIYRAMRGQA